MHSLMHPIGNITHIKPFCVYFAITKKTSRKDLQLQCDYKVILNVFFGKNEIFLTY